MNSYQCPYCESMLKSLENGFFACYSCRSLLAYNETLKELVSVEPRICPHCGMPDISESKSSRCKDCSNLTGVLCNNCGLVHSYTIFSADRLTFFPLPGFVIQTIGDLRKTECLVSKELEKRYMIQSEIERLYKLIFGSIFLNKESWRESVENFEFMIQHTEGKTELEKQERELRQNREAIRRLRTSLDKTARKVKAMAYNNRILVRVFGVLDQYKISEMHELLEDGF